MLNRAVNNTEMNTSHTSGVWPRRTHGPCCIIGGCLCAPSFGALFRLNVPWNQENFKFHFEGRTALHHITLLRRSTFGHFLVLGRSEGNTRPRSDKQRAARPAAVGVGLGSPGRPRLEEYLGGAPRVKQQVKLKRCERHEVWPQRPQTPARSPSGSGLSPQPSDRCSFGGLGNCLESL